MKEFDLKLHKNSYLTLIIIAILLIQMNTNVSIVPAKDARKATNNQSLVTINNQYNDSADKVNSSNLLGNYKFSANDSIRISTTYKIGSAKEFWVENLAYATDGKDNDNNGQDFADGDWNEAMYQISAVVVNITQSAYIFVEQDAQSKLQQQFSKGIASEIGQVFQERIQPTIASLGIPSDIDNNGKIIILVFPFKDTVSSTMLSGYFYPLNMYDSSPDKNKLSYYSNNGEIININSQIFNNKELTVDDWAPTIVHEYFHLMHYNYIQEEDLWFEEGLAVFTEYLTGFNSGYMSYLKDSYGNGFFNNAFDLSLTYFETKLENYGQSFLFILYLYQQFGLDFIRHIVQSNMLGMNAIKAEFEKPDATVSFAEVYNNWVLTNLINDPLNKTYSYSNITFKILKNEYNVNKEFKSIPSQSLYQILPFWSSEFYTLPQNSLQQYSITFHPEILSNYSNFQISLVTFHRNGSWELEKVPMISNKTSTFLVHYTDKSDSKVLAISSLCGCSSTTQATSNELINMKFYTAYNIYFDNNPITLQFELESLHDDLPTYIFNMQDIYGTTVSQSTISNISLLVYNWNLNIEIQIKNQNLTYNVEQHAWVIDYSTFNELDPGQYYFTIHVTFTNNRIVELRGLTFLYKTNPYPVHYFKNTVTQSSNNHIDNLGYFMLSIICLVIVFILNKRRKSAPTSI